MSYTDIMRQRAQCKWQFGNEAPNNKDKCRLCGKPYGDHYGAECPGKEDKDKN